MSDTEYMLWGALSFVLQGIPITLAMLSGDMRADLLAGFAGAQTVKWMLKGIRQARNREGNKS